MVKSRDSLNISSSHLGQSESIISVAISTNKTEKWSKMFQFFTSIFQKAKKNSNKKRINLERLRIVQEHIRNNREFGQDSIDNFTTYAPLLVLKLVCYLFSEDGARMKLERVKLITWGIRHKEILSYNPPGSGPIEKLSPREYLLRVIKCCWQAIANTGKDPNIDHWWFLTQFCRLYGFAATKLAIANNQMLPHLITIAGFPKLAPLMSKNEDTIYAIHLGYNHLDSKSNHMPSSPRSRRATLSSNSSINMASYAHTSRSSLDSSLSYTNLETKKITVEMVVLQLMECLTRPRSPLFPATLFHQLIKSIPLATSEPVPDHWVLEFQLSVEYLLDSETISLFTESPSHWFREGCDQSQLRQVNEMGLIKYHQSTSSESSQNTSNSDSITSFDRSLIPPIPIKYDPKLIASHLKHAIKNMSGLIPVAVARSIMSLMPPTPADTSNHNWSGTRDFQWCPDLEEVHLIRLLLGLGSWKFHLLQKIIQVTLHITYYSVASKDPIDAYSLAIVLPIIPADLLGNIKDIQRWNFCWGCLIHRGRELFLDPTFAIVIPEKVRQGFKWELSVLKEAGIKF